MTVLVESGHVNEYAFNHARILYGNASGAAVTATGEATNFEAALALTDSTYERWKPATSGDSITMSFAPQNINAIAIGAHNNVTLTLEVRTEGTAFETITAYRPDGEQTLDADFTQPDYALIDYAPDNQAVFFLIKERRLDAVRVTVTYASEAPTIGVIRAGKALEMQRPFYQGHSPGILSSDARVQPNTSESGEWLGASLIREGRSLQFAWNNLKADWVREKWVPFAQHIKTKPYFIAWNPLRFPSDVFYASSNQVPQPTNSGPLNYQSITLRAQAYSDGSDPIVESLGSKTFSELFTFSRNSIGTYYDASGTLQEAAADVPRLTYNPSTLAAEGLLIEESRSNLIAVTNRLTETTWSKSNVFAVQPDVISPAGKLDCTGVFENTVNSFHLISEVITTANGEYTLSAYLKPVNKTRSNLYMNDGTTTIGGQFNFSTETVTLQTGGSWTDISATITPVNNGWYRLTVTATSGAGTTIDCRIVFTDDAGSTSYQGDPNNGFYVYGFQLESGAFVTSFMPSVDTFTSRASTATYIDSNGNFQVAAVDEERSAAYEYDTDGNLQLIGQLLEPQRENRIGSPRRLYAAWTFTRSVFVNYAATAPDGFLTATKMMDVTGTSTTYFANYPNNFVSGQDYVFSIYAKEAELTQISLRFGNAGSAFNNERALFDLRNGTVSSLGSDPAFYGIQPAGNGWYRCWIADTAGATASGEVIVFTASAGSPTYSGDGKSGVLLWGAQLETDGLYVTSLTPDEVSFSVRSTSAGYFDSTGTYQEVGSNVERASAYGFDENGNPVDIGVSLIESGATNYMDFTRHLDFSGWTKTRSYLKRAVTSPDGFLNGFKVIEDTSTNTHYIAQTQSGVANGQYTASGYFKAGERDQLLFYMVDGTTASGASFNLTDQTYTITVSGSWTELAADISPVGNGWYYCWVKATRNAGTGTELRVYLKNGAGADNYAGDGQSGLYVWGLQLVEQGKPTSLTPDNAAFTSRSTTATYYDVNGVIQTAAINTARSNAYAHDELTGSLVQVPLLLEVSTTNLFVRSEEFDNASWTKTRATVTANAAIAPDDATTGDELVSDATASNTHICYQNLNYTSGSAYTLSVFAKASTLSQIELQLPSAAFGTSKSRLFNLLDGTTAAGGASQPRDWDIQLVGNGWYRCSISDVATATALGQTTIFLAKEGSRTFDGDGSSGVYVWGAQVENFAVLTSYIPTVASTVTRAADVATAGDFTRQSDVTSAGPVTRSADVYTSTALTRQTETLSRSMTIEYNKPAWTLYMEFIYDGNGKSNTAGLFEIGGDGTTNTSGIDCRINTDGSVVFGKSGSGTTLIFPSTTISEGGSYKFAVSFDGTNALSALDGAAGTAATSPTPDFTFLELMRHDYTVNRVLNGKLKNFQLYPVTKTQAELQALTS